MMYMGIVSFFRCLKVDFLPVSTLEKNAEYVLELFSGMFRRPSVGRIKEEVVQKVVVADLLKTLRQHMHEKAADKFLMVKSDLP